VPVTGDIVHIVFALPCVTVTGPSVSRFHTVLPLTAGEILIRLAVFEGVGV
jgi:hypothetical protein